MLSPRQFPSLRNQGVSALPPRNKFTKFTEFTQTQDGFGFARRTILTNQHNWFHPKRTRQAEETIG